VHGPTKINLQATDPDGNPLFLFFLLSLIILVLLVSISVADKLLQIEREKEYDPQEDDVTFPTLHSANDTEQNILWSNNIIVPDFKVNNSHSLMAPSTPKKEKDRSNEEYNRLKQQLTSAPDNNRDSFMSIASERTTKVVSVDEFSISSSYRRQDNLDDHSVYLHTDTVKSGDDRLAAFLARDKQDTVKSGDDRLAAFLARDEQDTVKSGEDRLAAFLARDMNSNPPIVNKRTDKIKSGIPSARLSTLSVMSTDSLL